MIFEETYRNPSDSSNNTLESLVATPFFKTSSANGSKDWIDDNYLSGEEELMHGFNYTIEEMLRNELNQDYPLRDPLSVAVPMTLIYSLILISGIIGNILTFVVISKNSYMHTPVNFYLISLAMSDLLLLLSGLPQEIYHIWIKHPYMFGEAFCIIRGLAAETSSNATVLTITSFTVERFFAIVYPLKSHKLSKLSRVVRLIGAIWVLAFCLAIPQAAQFGVIDQMSRYVEGHVLVKKAWCTIAREIFPYAFQISICVFFLVPMTVITVLYFLIWLKLRGRRNMRLRGARSSFESSQFRTSGSALRNVPSNAANSQSHVIRMLVAVVVAFFVCWAPFHVQRLMAIYGSSFGVESKIFHKTYEIVTHVSGVLYYVSTCVNPFLYHIFSKKFRMAFEDTLRKLCGDDDLRTNLHSQQALTRQSIRMSTVSKNTNYRASGRYAASATCSQLSEPGNECSSIDSNKEDASRSKESIGGVSGNVSASFTPKNCLDREASKKLRKVWIHGRKTEKGNIAGSSTMEESGPVQQTENYMVVSCGKLTKARTIGFEGQSKVDDV